MSHDLVIRNAFLVDGSGQPGRHADVAVDGSTITAVEAAGTMGSGTHTVEADGRLLTPGFVDMHTHYDAQVSWDPWITPSSWHGVTTVMMGNCGVGFAPARPHQHEWLIQLMEGVEDIPGSALTAGITWGWESFPEYLDVVGRQQYVIDVGAQVAHSPVRAYVMGERANTDEPATDAEIAAMAAMVEDALARSLHLHARVFDGARALRFEFCQRTPRRGHVVMDAEYAEQRAAAVVQRDLGRFHPACRALFIDEQLLRDAALRAAIEQAEIFAADPLRVIAPGQVIIGQSDQGCGVAHTRLPRELAIGAEIHALLVLPRNAHRHGVQQRAQELS